ncbi:MAG: DUF707 domain-containing protein [Terriglobales bacterium]
MPAAFFAIVSLESGMISNLTKIQTIKRYGFFLEADYARHYLGSAYLARLAIPHYVLIGESIGHRPHPLFDPIAFRKKAGSRVRRAECAVIAYIERFAAEDVSPSAEFDHGWYAWQNPDWGHAFSHPFLHCVIAGLPAGRDPAPGIDVRQLVQTSGLSGTRIASAMYDEICRHGRLSDSYAIYSFDDLRARQDAFRKAIRVEKLIDRRVTKRRFLVFVQANCEFHRNFLCQRRTFDVLLNHYDRLPDKPNVAAEIVIYQRGTKTTAVSKLLEIDPDLLTSYDAVLFLDDDIDLTTQQIERLFAIMTEHDLDLVQPSLSAESDCVWHVFKQPNVGDGVRRVNSVEIMMPCLSRHALKEVGWVFSESVSGFGVDLLLGHMLSTRGDARAGVVGSVVARHEKKIDDGRGSFYNVMRANKINPKMELWSIVKRFNVTPNFVYIP